MTSDRKTPTVGVVGGSRLCGRETVGGRWRSPASSWWGSLQSNVASREASVRLRYVDIQKGGGCGSCLVDKERLRQTFHLTADGTDRETIERVLDVYEDGCPVARSIKDSIEITSELDLSTKS